VGRVIPKLFINGEFVDAVSGATFDDMCPSNEALICKVAEGDAADIDAAVKAARQAFDKGPWGTMSGRVRSRCLGALLRHSRVLMAAIAGARASAVQASGRY